MTDKVLLVRLVTRDDVSYYLDDIQKAIVAMLKKTGSHGTSAEKIMTLLIQHCEDIGFVLIALSPTENGNGNYKFIGLLFAIFVAGAPSWVEVVALYNKPGWMKVVQKDTFRYLSDWSREKGATKIITIVTRSPEHFFSLLHEPLGFKKIGLVLEVKL